MDSDGRSRSSASRSGSRRSLRCSDWRENSSSVVKSNSIHNLSSSEEELTNYRKPKSLTPRKKTERSGSGRSKVTPSDLVTASEPELDKDVLHKETSRGLTTIDPSSMSQLPPHYFQDPADSSQYGNSLEEYDNPILKANPRGIPNGRGRRLGPNQQGSSLSSSDNNSDTTYAESDINNSLRARMAAFDNEIAGTPPDPAPPEVPPRGPSHHHPLLTSQRRGGPNPSSPHYSDQQEDGYQQPATGVFLSQEYLMSGTSPRYGGSGGAKSPGGPALFGPSPTREYLPSDFSQPGRMIGTLSSHKGSSGGLTSTIGGPGVGLTSLPTVRNNLTLGSRSSFSGRDLHLGKTWKEKCSWRCIAIIVIGVCAVLAALLTYFAVAYASLDGGTKGCIVVEDAAKVIAQGADVKDTTIAYPTPEFTIPVTTANPNQPSQKDSSSTGTELTRLQSFNKRYSSPIAPQGHWNVQFNVKQPMFMRFNMSVPRSSQIAFYGRRLVAPSITQYNFVEFLRSGRTTRVKRALTTTAVPEGINENVFLSASVKSWLDNSQDDDYYDYDIDDEDEYYQDYLKDEVTDKTHRRNKRYLNSRQVNVSMVEYLDTGTWYLSIYNDGLASIQVSLLVEEAPELQSACLNDCSEHGSCTMGRCECVQGWVGEDCSKSVCPILCSGHGTYGGGVCHCNKDWKGQECDVPLNDCEIPDCKGHGTCIGGECLCQSGWKGDRCDIVDCHDPTCGNHGWCIEGVCVCRAGWQGHNCSQVDHKVFTCLPDCSGNGHYDLHTSACICDSFWTGPDCSEARCALNCQHGTCDGGVCACEVGWTGARCNERDCDDRCNLHGQCHNGTCLCIQGWNGRHCTIPGCLNGCSGNGLCTTEAGEYRCSCSDGWAGKDCSVALETQCNDEQDNDGDSLADCNDSECCSTPECNKHVLCMVSADPVEVLLRKQPPAVTASFYQRVKFIIEDKNVQNFARKDEFTESQFWSSFQPGRVSVIRGQVVNKQGQGIVGVRTSIDKETKFGLTATRNEGWFDVLVNGGGAVTLQFTRAHFEPLTLTVPVLWNQIVVLDPVVMWLKDKPKPIDNKASKLKWSEPCVDHNDEIMKPQTVSTFMPQAIGSTSEKSAVLTETQIVQESLRIPGSNLNLVYHSCSVAGYLSTLLLQLTPSEISKSLSMVHLKVVLEGSIYEKVFEADPNITYTFTWNKRNVYKQKVYGEAVAKVSVGYEYTSCSDIVWETQTAKLQGFQMDISDIGGWNLNIHHMYNFEAGLLQRGDGSTLNVKDVPRIVSTVIGTGSQRPLKCGQCHGLAKDASILSPSALASGSDGSIYIGDFNLIRRVSPEGMVSTILELSGTQVSYGYYLSVSPADDHVYISDPEKYRVIRLLQVANVTDTSNNLEVVAGNGERCIPGDERRCGDKGLAKKARLSHPKGLAISSDRTMYIADGTNIRMVDPQGIIHTLIGHHGHRTRWKPLPCSGGLPANLVELQWPTALALSTLDDTLHILDDHVVLQVTNDGSVRVEAGSPLHCRTAKDQPNVGTITSFAFSPSGSLFLAEETSNKVCIIKELGPTGKLEHFAGAKPADCGCVPNEECTCVKEKVSLSTNILLKSVSAITVSANSVVHVAEQNALKVYGFLHYLPEDDENGDYKVAYPKTNELYIFNRHGHHIETRDLVTDRKLYSFLYSKNTSFGKLSKVTDSSGNKIMFLRDYKSSVSQIENTFGKKFKVEISRLRLMTRFSESDDRVFDFTYHDDSGLLLSKTTPGRLTTAYEYDYTGRLITVVSPTGSRLGLKSFMGGSVSKRHLSIQVGVDDMQPSGDAAKRQRSHELSIKNGIDVEFRHHSVFGSLESWSNGTWRQTFPWGGQAKAISSTSNPLLEAVLPTQAKLLPTSQQYTLSAASEGATNVHVTSYGIVDDRQRHERLVETVFLVNGSRVLSREWKGSALTEELTDGDRKSMLKIDYNKNGQTLKIVLGNNLSTMNVSYDKFGRMSSKKWEKAGEEYDYDQNGFLSAVTTKTSAVTRYTFNDNGRLESVTLPSGRSWGYRYDKKGGLKFVTTPSGSAHVFSIQPSFGTYVFSYTPPGSQHPYLQHLDHNGNLIYTSFPTGSAKILYTYTDSDQLKMILSGDGKTVFNYGPEGLVIEIIHEEIDLEYKIDKSYNGRLLEEFRLDYGARTGLSNVKFTYEYDSNFRVTNFGGRIGGQNLHSFPYTYSHHLGIVDRIGFFKISRPNNNEIVIHDGTAIFSRTTDFQFQVTRLSLTIHKMEVFRLDITYTKDGKIVQTNSHTRNFHTKPYTNAKNYTYDADGQLISVDAKEPWNFSYDAFGNMLSLTYSTNTIPMKYDSQDRIVKFGEGGYKYNTRGAIVQSVREVNYQYNARGMLIKAFKSGRFNIKYIYDHEGRLIARKDNFGNVTQFMYSDRERPDLVSHIYNPRDGNLITLVYDDRGHIIFAQMYRNKYYIATDQCGTPVMVFNQYGEVVREIMRSPYGHIIYDSNPYLYLPIDYCGGILDTKTELVHMPGGKVYDPLIGLLLSPEWEEIPKNLMTPNRLSLYRFNGNDPINIKKSLWRSFEIKHWLGILGYSVDGIAPQMSLKNSPKLNSGRKDLWNAFTRINSLPSRRNLSPFTDQVKAMQCISGILETQQESLHSISRLSSLRPSLLRRDFQPDSHKFEISTSAGPFGEGVLVSIVEGRALISATPQANPIFRDVLTSVFNSSLLLDVVLMSRNIYVFYFVKENYWKASEDMTQLNRIGGEVNITVHEPSTSPSQGPEDDKVVDIKLHSSSAIIHIRYGTTPSLERRRLLKHAKKMTIRRAWAEERARLSVGLPGTLDWSTSEVEELMTHGSVSSYSARYLHQPETYPQLLDDPTNIQIIKDAKRTRRNSKSRKSHRCKKKWWRVFC